MVNELNPTLDDECKDLDIITHIVHPYPKTFYDTFCIGSIIFVGIEIFDIALFLQHLLYFRFLGYTKTLFLLSVIPVMLILPKPNISLIPSIFIFV